MTTGLYEKEIRQLQERSKGRPGRGERFAPEVVKERDLVLLHQL